MLQDGSERESDISSRLKHDIFTLLVGLRINFNQTRGDCGKKNNANHRSIKENLEFKRCVKIEFVSIHN